MRTSVNMLNTKRVVLLFISLLFIGIITAAYFTAIIGNFSFNLTKIKSNNKICDDNKDNDFDSKIDCNDKDCFDNTKCKYPILNINRSILGPPNFGNCCIDNELKVCAFTSNSCGIGRNLTNSRLTSSQCNSEISRRGYRNASYYKSAPNFALVCTTPCSINDTGFLNASFEGMKLGINSLNNSTGGVLPKLKMEFHQGKDGNCFTEGYGDHPTGYATRTASNNPLLCNSGYWWYLNLGIDERPLSYYSGIESQTLTIHEPIHSIFEDYSGILLSPDYKIQESFAKAISLVASGVALDYTDYFLHGEYTISNPPREGDPIIYTFFIYSLNQRYGFDQEDAKAFFIQYKNMENSAIDPELKTKLILDNILRTDTTASFNDVGIYFN